MDRRSSLAAVILMLALSAWLGAVVGAGTGAAVIFPVVKGLEPHSPVFESYPGEHWRIIAGQVANWFFVIAGWVCVVAIPLTASALFLLRSAVHSRGRTWSMIAVPILGLAWVGGATATASIFGMARMFGRFYESAREGDSAMADGMQQQFQAAHMPVSIVMTVSAGLVLVNFLMWGWLIARAGGGRETVDMHVD